MATSKDNSLGYRTHVIGTAKPVLESTRIVLYNKYQFASNSDYSRISVYNIDRIYKIVSSSSLSLTLTRVPNGKFEYNYSNQHTEGFNIIIYLSNFDNTPIGYTEFLRTQGKDRNINISIDLETTIEGDITVNLVNSLAPLRNTSSIERVFTGTELWDYTPSRIIKSEVKKILPNSRYTTHLTAFTRDRSVRNIYLLNCLVNQEDRRLKLSKLDITRNIEADPFSLGFSNYQISYYGNELAFYTWNREGIYCIISLTERNMFNRPIYYTRTDDASFKLPDGYEIDYFAGHFIVCKDGTIFDSLTNNSLVMEQELGHKNIIDPLDPKSKIYSIPQLTYENVYRVIPEISNIYLDLRNYIRTYGLVIHRKIGSWFILERTLRGETLYLLVNQSTRFYLTSTDLSKLIIVNDRVIMFEEDNYYLFYFLDEGEYWTERARATKPGTELSLDETLEVLFCHGGEDDDEYKNYFLTNKIERVFKSYPVYDSILNSFRKNYYNVEEFSTLPNIIGACDGVLFFLTKDKKFLEYL